MPLQDLTGQKFGRLTALERVGSDGNGNSTWRLECECGETKVAAAHNLKAGFTRSCGCLRRAQADANLGKSSKRQGSLRVDVYQDNSDEYPRQNS